MTYNESSCPSQDAIALVEIPKNDRNYDRLRIVLSRIAYECAIQSMEMHMDQKEKNRQARLARFLRLRHYALRWEDFHNHMMNLDLPSDEIIKNSDESIQFYIKELERLLNDILSAANDSYHEDVMNTFPDEDYKK